MVSFSMTCEDNKISGICENTIKAYLYQPLLPGHIRLLQVDEELKDLKIIHTAFDSAPAYAAISYTWDGQPSDQNLLIEKSNLKVIKNITFFLSHLVQKAKSTYFWIDGICINQADNGEKAIQVPLMREIYSQCQECLIWLGKGTPESDLAIDRMPSIVQQLELQDREEVWEREGIAATSPGVQDSLLWKGLLDIFSRSWFRRVWTFQEAVLPTNVFFFCGSKIIALPDIGPAAAHLLALLAVLQRSFPGAEWQGRNYFVGFLKLVRISTFRAKVSQLPEQGLENIKLMYFTRPWSATNRLDKVYGVLGLLDRTLQDHLVVNYQKTTAEISREIAEWYIKKGEDLFLLNIASYRKREADKALPSWIPNFAEIGDHWSIGVIWHRFRTGLNDASPFKNAAVMHGDELHVNGFCVDQVRQVIPFSKKANRSNAERAQDILEWEEACLAVSKATYGQDDIPEAHYTALIPGICDKHLKATQNDYDLLKSYLKSLASNEPFSPEVEARHQHLAPQFRRLSQPKTFFCTQNGRIGLGLTTVLPGDYISVFHGGFTPFVIRRKEDGCGKCQFIGDCYTYGLMHGEVFHEGASWQEETFVLV
jgi:hypothetical protein